jgi:hypothetical protein
VLMISSIGKSPYRTFVSPTKLASTSYPFPTFTKSSLLVSIRPFLSLHWLQYLQTGTNGCCCSIRGDNSYI